MIEAIGLISVFAVFGAIVLFVFKCNNENQTQYSEAQYSAPVSKMFKVIFTALGIFCLITSIFSLLGGPDGKFGSIESIIYGSVGLIVTLFMFLIARSFAKRCLTNK